VNSIVANEKMNLLTHPHHQNSQCDRLWVPQLMGHDKGVGELMEEKI